MVEFFDFIF
jgi:hypothetical protein